MNTPHTPGPWVVRHLTGFPIMIATQPDFDGFGVPVADCSKRNLPAEAEANARLIAAAPDLLAALESLVCVASHEGLPFDLEPARDAINKAKGVTA